jgi:hypothetical protein
MTDHNPVSGKGHVRDIMMTEAVEKLAVISFGQAVFNGPYEVTAAGKEGKKKKDKEVASENGHDGVPWIKKT